MVSGLANVQKKQDILAGQLAVHDDKIAKLKSEFEDKTGIATKLELGLKQAEATCNKASSLIGKLSEEKVRWQQEEQFYKKQIDRLIIDCVKAGAFQTFLTSLTEQDRVVKMRELNFGGFDVLEFLCNETEQLSWKSMGLKSDKQSLENFCVQYINSNNSFFPLIQDPSGQLVDFFKHYYKKLDYTVETISKHSSQFYSTLELALRFGKVLIVTNIDDKIPEVLYSVIRQDVVGDDSRKSVVIGDKHVDYSEDFRLILITNHSSPSIKNSVKPYLTRLNYSATQEGLSSQLLAIAIQNVRPDLEEKRFNLVKQTESARLKLAELENNLLVQLANCEGSILENENLLASLNNSKIQALDQKKALKESETMRLQFDSERNAYLPLAEIAMKVFFAIDKLSGIEKVYKFGLGHFTKLYKICVGKNGEMKDIKKEFISIVFRYVMLSIKSADILTVGIFLAKTIGNFNEIEFSELINVLSAVANEMDKSNERSSISSTWQAATNRAFASLSSSTKNKISGSNSGNNSMLISSIQDILSSPDKGDAVLTSLICKTVGVGNLVDSENMFDLALSFGSNTPILMLVSPGADPSQTIRDMAAREVGKEKFQEIALGQGKQDTALEMVKSCQNNGCWLLIQNLHLYTHWIPKLEGVLSENEANAKSGFRLLLTSEPHDNIPMSLLENSVKISFEAPPGLKNNILRLLQNWKDVGDFQNGGASRARALYTLSWLHSVCLERRRYQPVGWINGINYEFNLADLRSAKYALEEILSRKSKEVKRGGIAWKSFHGILSSTIYGGRLNSTDLKILNSHLEELFNDRILSKSANLGSGALSLPASAKIDEYIDVTERSCPNDEPVILGLAANVDKTMQSQRNLKLVNGIKKLTKNDLKNKQVTTNKLQRRKSVDIELANIIQTWKESSQKLKFPDIQSDSKSSPLELFFSLESKLAKKIVDTISADLDTVLTIPENIKKDILMNEIPDSWISGTSFSCDFNSIEEFLKGFSGSMYKLSNFISSNFKNLKPGIKIDLGILLRPTAFLQACSQTAARMLKTTIDEIVFVNEANGIGVEASKNGFYVKLSNLSAEGARIGMSGGGLMLNELGVEDEPVVQIAGDVKLIWIEKSKISEGKVAIIEKKEMVDGGVVKIPVYSSLARTKEVFSFVIRSDNPSKWVQLGVSIFI